MILMKMIKEILWMNTTDLSNLTLSTIKKKMHEENFNRNFVNDLIDVLSKRENKLGKKEFRYWLYTLDFICPEEFQNESYAEEVYHQYHSWIENEVNKLENETKLSWEEQTADIKELSIEARKAQLVIRHRLTEIIMDLV